MLSSTLRYILGQVLAFEPLLPKNRGGFSCRRIKNQGFDTLMADQPVSIGQTGEYILPFQPGITFQQSFHSIARGQHAKDVLDRQPASAVRE